MTPTNWQDKLVDALYKWNLALLMNLMAIGKKLETTDLQQLRLISNTSSINNIKETLQACRKKQEWKLLIINISSAS